MTLKGAEVITMVIAAALRFRGNFEMARELPLKTGPV